MSLAYLNFICAVILCALGCAHAVKLTQAEKDDALYRHNLARCQVESPAQSMPPMVWDDNLERVAQEYADTCFSSHSSSSARLQKYISYSGDKTAWWVGENLAWGYTSMGSAVTDGWVSEIRNYGYAQFSGGCKTGNWGDCGHYTQVIWSGTLKVGCARNNVPCPYYQSDYFICNYQTGGNIQGGYPYPLVSKPSTAFNAACAAIGYPQPSGSVVTTTAAPIPVTSTSTKKPITTTSTTTTTTTTTTQGLILGGTGCSVSTGDSFANIAGIGTATTNVRIVAGFKAPFINDGNLATGWRPNRTDTAAQLLITFPSKILLSYMEVEFASSATIPTRMSLQHYDASGAWIMAGNPFLNYSTTHPNSKIITRRFPSNVVTSQVRLMIPQYKGSGIAPQPHVLEFRVFAKQCRTAAPSK